MVNPSDQRPVEAFHSSLHRVPGLQNFHGENDDGNDVLQASHVNPYSSLVPDVLHTRATFWEARSHQMLDPDQDYVVSRRHPKVISDHPRIPPMTLNHPYVP